VPKSQADEEDRIWQHHRALMDTAFLRSAMQDAVARKPPENEADFEAGG
jgi:hypothetical protein